jgi:excisionase family DNA binding protein
VVGAFLTMDELVRLLGISRSTVYYHIKRGRIPAVKMGRQWRFNRESIEKLMKRARPLEDPES